jgi:hypothetical protein
MFFVEVTSFHQTQEHAFLTAQLLQQEKEIMLLL